MSVRPLVAPIAGAWLALILCSSAAAQNAYPNKPVKVMVALPAGGSADMIARVISQKLGEQLGQSFVVDNKAGATYMTGAAGQDFSSLALGVRHNF